MLRSGYGVLAAGVLIIGAVGMGGDAGCSASKPTELVPGATTQVELPKDLGGLRVIVVANGQKVFDQGYSVTNGIAILPATLGIVANGPASTVVTIAMFGYEPSVIDNPACNNMGWQDNLQNPQPVGSQCGPSVERGSTQTYVDQHILFLPMPLSYACWGNDSCTGTNAPGTTSQTCKGGQCVDVHVDAKTLADFDPSLLDGTQDCFSPSTCFKDAVEAQALDAEGCTYGFPEQPPGPGLNVRVFYEDLKYDMTQNPPALVSQKPSSEEEVLDSETAAQEGFTRPEPGKPQVFKLAPGLCSLVQAGIDPVGSVASGKVKVPPSGILHAITGVQVASACGAKTQLLPFCTKEQSSQAQGQTADGGASSVACNTPIVLQPAPSSIYLVMDDSAVMNAAFGQQGYATAMSLSLVDPIFKRTDVAFRFLDHQPSDCTATGTPYGTPMVDFGLANGVQSKIAAQLLNVTPPDTTSSPAPLDLQTALRLDQGAYAAVSAHQASQSKSGQAPGIGAVMLFVNRIPDSTMGGADGGAANPFPGADCSPALDSAMDTNAQSAIEQQITAASAAGLQTFFVVLNDDSMLGNQVVGFYQKIKSDLGGKGVAVIDATSPKSQASTVLANFSSTVTQLGTCLYEVPPGIDTKAKMTFTIPVPVPNITSSAPTPVPVSFDANCSAANQSMGDGWNIEGDHIRICGTACNHLQQAVEGVTAVTLASSPDGGIASVPEVPVTVTVPCSGSGSP